MKNIVKKVIPISDGIFSHIDYQFLDFDSVQLDMLFVSRCGLRTVSPVVWMLQDNQGDSLTPAQLDTLGSLILKMYKPKWDKISRLIDLEYDPIHNFSDITTEDILDNTSEENSSNSSLDLTSEISEVLDKKSEVVTEDDFEKGNTGTKTLEKSSSDEENVSGTSNSTRTDDLLESISSTISNDSTRTDNLTQSVSGTSSETSTRTYDLNQSFTAANKEDSTRTDSLSESIMTFDSSNNTRTDNLLRSVSHTGHDSSSESGQNNVFGFNSVTAVGDKTDARESSGTTTSTDSTTDTGTQTTVTESNGSKSTSNTGTQNTVTDVTKGEITKNEGTVETVTAGSDSEDTTNTGTVKTVESNTESSSKENTGTQTETGTSSKISSTERSGSEVTTDALKETNKGTRTVNEDANSTTTTTGSSSKKGENSAEKHNEYTRSRTLTRNGNIGNITTQQLVREEIELWRWNFIEEVLNDVKDFLTISVYD